MVWKKRCNNEQLKTATDTRITCWYKRKEISGWTADYDQCRQVWHDIDISHICSLWYRHRETDINPHWSLSAWTQPCQEEVMSQHYLQWYHTSLFIKWLVCIYEKWYFRYAVSQCQRACARHVSWTKFPNIGGQRIKHKSGFLFFFTVENWCKKNHTFKN